MKRNATILLVFAFVLGAFALSAADLTIDYQVNTVREDYAANYLTFQGKAASAMKDQLDAVSGASKLESTVLFNIYRFDIYGGKLLPGAFRSLFLYPVADDATRTGDGLSVSKNADGAIVVRFAHRGTANEIVTGTDGVVRFPTTVK
ncbi:MAG: hypothetical protein Q8M76_06740, partial [Spirochaetaceae bacterium]|nr:hypothetical protein [Spirochaetaceae bacterium]